jgi:hypothetical protein
MAALVVSGNSLLTDDSFPFIQRGAASSVSSYTTTITGPAHACYLVLGFDFALGPDEPVQTWFTAANGSSVFYRDSQSTGEGLGVTYAWRGQLPITSGFGLTLACTMFSTISLGWIVWGIQLNRPISGT